MAGKTIRIPVPGGSIMAHGKALSEIVLREPTYDEYLSLGDPTVLTKAPNGALFVVEDGETIKRYVELCLVEPKEPLLLDQGGMKLARAVKGAVLSFFRDETTEDDASKTSPTSSLSASESPLTP